MCNSESKYEQWLKKALYATNIAKTCLHESFLVFLF